MFSRICWLVNTFADSISDTVFLTEILTKTEKVNAEEEKGMRKNEAMSECPQSILSLQGQFLIDVNQKPLHTLITLILIVCVCTLYAEPLFRMMPSIDSISTGPVLSSSTNHPNLILIVCVCTLCADLLFRIMYWWCPSSLVYRKPRFLFKIMGKMKNKKATDTHNSYIIPHTSLISQSGSPTTEKVQMPC